MDKIYAISRLASDCRLASNSQMAETFDLLPEVDLDTLEKYAWDCRYDDLIYLIPIYREENRNLHVRSVHELYSDWKLRFAAVEDNVIKLHVMLDVAHRHPENFHDVRDTIHCALVNAAHQRCYRAVRILIDHPMIQKPQLERALQTAQGKYLIKLLQKKIATL